MPMGIEGPIEIEICPVSFCTLYFVVCTLPLLRDGMDTGYRPLHSTILHNDIQEATAAVSWISQDHSAQPEVKKRASWHVRSAICASWWQSQCGSPM
jgi:hypothetical protein